MREDHGAHEGGGGGGRGGRGGFAIFAEGLEGLLSGHGFHHRAWDVYWKQKTESQKLGCDLWVVYIRLVQF